MLRKALIVLLSVFCLTRAASAVTAVPVLMFHRICDAPKYPEEISTAQLEALFNFLWKSGWAPASVSDLAAGRLDEVVPRGKKPVVLTIDDGHPSVIYSAAQHPALKLNNRKSFLTVLCETCRAHRLEPRATAFISESGGYFGGRERLSSALARIHNSAPNFEAGYHTRAHKLMKSMTPAQFRAALVSQREQFRSLGVLKSIAPVLAYPYGIAPAFGPQSILKELGFTAAVLAFAGNGEQKFSRIPRCRYDGTLKSDRFLIPRASIGARGYAFRKKGSFVIDPIADFKKDTAFPDVTYYVSKGKR